MRVALLAVILLLATLLSSAAQQTSPASPQPLQILQQALSALNGSTQTRDVTLSGSAHYVAGSDDETGTAELTAIATGASSMKLSLSSGPRNEVRNLTVDPPTGTWSGPDGISHNIIYHNLLNEPSWFSPVAAISRVLASPESAASFVGTETIDSQNVQHVSITQGPPASAASVIPASLPHLTQVDLYLDSTSFLPAAMRFSIHPDDNALLDIPIEVRFSDYRNVSGTQIPFHVQRFLNNGLVLDLQFQSAVINSGITPNGLAIQ
jgi:hypothetical protein